MNILKNIICFRIAHIKCIFVAKNIILIPVFYLIACQTSIDVTGNQHKLAAEKWKALANYAESSLSRFDITITAKLVSEKDNANKYDKLANIHLSFKESYNNINLLSPDFLSKYTCSYNCERLNLYIPDPLQSGNTALIRYFSEYEFQLFKFYAELIKLNHIIDSIADKNPTLWANYLNILITEVKTFDSLAEFSHYLNEMLNKSDTEMQYLVDSLPYRQQESDIEKLFASPRKNWSVAYNDNKWHETAGNGRQKPANDGWQSTAFSFNNIEKIDFPWIKYKKHLLNPDISEQFKQTETKLSPLSNDLVIETDLSLWASAQTQQYVVGDKVCSFSENIFGIVQKIEKNEVQISTLGQAKFIDEFGIEQDEPQGALFDNNKEFTFQTLSKIQTFNRDGIAKCNIETL